MVVQVLVWCGAGTAAAAAAGVYGVEPGLLCAAVAAGAEPGLSTAAAVAVVPEGGSVLVFTPSSVSQVSLKHHRTQSAGI